jgi:hypothetical protein
MKYRRQKKGIFSTISGFFLIIVIVFGLIFFLALYTNLVNIGGFVKSDLRSYDVAKQFKGNLLICHGQTMLFEGILNLEPEDVDYCPLSSLIKGYRVEQVAALECEENNWSFGETGGRVDQVVVYNLIVVQEDGRTCIGKLYVHV